MKGTNTTNRLGTTYDTRENEMACFDALPPPLRDLVRLNATNLSAGSVLNYLGSIARQAGPGQAVAITVATRMVRARLKPCAPLCKRPMLCAVIH